MIYEETRRMMIKEAKIYLGGYHIDLSKFTVAVEEVDDTTVMVEFFAPDSRKKILVGPCYYNETQILRVMGMEFA